MQKMQSYCNIVDCKSVICIVYVYFMYYFLYSLVSCHFCPSRSSSITVTKKSQIEIMSSINHLSVAKLKNSYMSTNQSQYQKRCRRRLGYHINLVGPRSNSVKVAIIIVPNTNHRILLPSFR